MKSDASLEHPETSARLRPSPVRDTDAHHLSALVQRARDEGTGDPAAHLETILATDREADSLTLWHLLAPIDGVEGGAARVYDRLQQLVPAPANVTREGVLSGDEAMRELWKQEFSWDRGPPALPGG